MTLRERIVEALVPYFSAADCAYKEHHDAADAALAAIEAAGFVIVPAEPTEAMIEASNREWDGRMSHRSSGAYKAMIAARPRDVATTEQSDE